MDDARIVAFKSEVDKVVKFLYAEFGKLQTGRASAALIEHLEVEAYGARQPLKTVAGITIQDARSIVVQPWDRTVIANVEKALQNADLGASPVNDGHVIRINLPPMTQERREQMVKVVHKLAEEARISLRQQRQAVLDKIKEEKDEDARFTLQEVLQKTVEAGNEEIEKASKGKEEEIMKV